MRGGMVPFKGDAAAAARSYLAKDRSVADDYFLEAGQLMATRHILDSDGVIRDRSLLDGDGYEAWAGWVDPETGESRGLVRSGDERASTVFLDKIVNVDKTLSVAAILDDRIAEQLDLAMSAATDEMLSYIAQNVRTRVGPRGAQKWIPVERFEAVTVAHRTSREGDPHRHLHVQLLNRVYAEGTWRSLHTASLLKINEAMNRLAEGVLNSHAELQNAIAAAGYTVNPETGAIIELDSVAETMSKRRAQISERSAALLAQWEAAHPGESAGKAVLEDIDHRAWAETRREKTPATMSTTEEWKAEIAATGFTPPTAPVPRVRRSLNDVDSAAVIERAVGRLEAGESAWSLARMTAAIAHELDLERITVSPSRFSAVVDTLTRRAVDTRCRLLEPGADLYALPAHLKMLTTEGIEREETLLKGLLLTTALEPVASRIRAPQRDIVLDPHTDMAQEDLETVLAAAGCSPPDGEAHREALRVLGGTSNLVVITGAAGSGKTTLLKAASVLAEARMAEQLIVAPSAKAAGVAREETNDRTATAHKLLHDYGYRWTTDPSTGASTWRRLSPGQEGYTGVPAGRALRPGTQLVIDEAGMLSQDVAVRLLEVARETRSRVVLTGDHAQLGAVGRGGVLQIAQTSTTAHVDLNRVHRFRDHEYAALSLQMRERLDPAAQFYELHRMGLIRLHETAGDAHYALARTWEHAREAGDAVVISASTNEQADAINTKILIDPSPVAAGPHPIAGNDGNPITRGALIMCRRNDSELRVLNRQCLNVLAVGPESVRVQEAVPNGRVFSLPRDYVQEHTHLGYAVTTHAAQGVTVDEAHLLLTDQTDAAGMYVGMTRGRASNTLHLIASTMSEALEQYVAAVARDRADNGLDQARRDLAEQLDGMSIPAAPIPPDPHSPRIPGSGAKVQEFRADRLPPGRPIAAHDGVPHIYIGSTPNPDGTLRLHCVPFNNPSGPRRYRDARPDELIPAVRGVRLPPAPGILERAATTRRQALADADIALEAARTFLAAAGDPDVRDTRTNEHAAICVELETTRARIADTAAQIQALEQARGAQRDGTVAQLRTEVFRAEEAVSAAGLFSRRRAQRDLTTAQQNLATSEAAPLPVDPQLDVARQALETLTARETDLTLARDDLTQQLALPRTPLPQQYGAPLATAADLPRASEILETAQSHHDQALKTLEALANPDGQLLAATWMLHRQAKASAPAATRITATPDLSAPPMPGAGPMRIPST